MEWLNTNVLIGNTDKRGHAWHWREGSDNHYPLFIPVSEVERRLFNFDPISAPAAWLRPIPSGESTLLPNVIRVQGGYFQVMIDEEHQAIVDPEQGIAFDYPTNEYQIHNYRQWLLKNVATILDADIGITSAGLLRRRAQAWVEVSVPDSIETKEGFTFRPNLLVFTSLDRTLATTYKRTIGAVVCDNTLAARIGEEGETFSIRHTSGSLGRISEAREALNIVYKTADEFTAQLTALCQVEVSDRQWQGVLDALVPYPEEKKGRAFTMRDKKREKLDHLYRWDTRCSPWKGTKFGVIQTFNTYQQHEAIVRNTHGGGRTERNQLNALSGKTEAFDTLVAEAVDNVLAAS
jgi:phage/plasmid-like protein (TIGR03299 family)